MTKIFFGTIMKMVVEVLISRAILAVIMILGTIIFINKPVIKAAFANYVAKCQTAPIIVVPAALPKLSEEDLPPPPIEEAAPDLAAPAEARAPAAAPAAEAGPDETFDRVMKIYEDDEKSRAGETATSNESSEN